MKTEPITIVGEVFVDLMLREDGEAEPSMRLGGAVHAARALWAMGIDYNFYAILPAYLISQAKLYLAAHGASRFTVIGIVDGCPLVMVSQRPREVASQRYEFILRDEYQVDWQIEGLNKLWEEKVSAVLILSGAYELSKALERISNINVRLHIDIANSPLSKINNHKHPIQTYITSTSGSDFINAAKNSAFDDENTIHSFVREIAKNNVENVLLKENRGGSRLFSCKTGKEVARAAAQLIPAVHSIGVGDCYDAAYVALQELNDPHAIMAYASWISACYAETTYVDDFKRSVQLILKKKPGIIKNIVGCFVPWDKRKKIKFYVAGADFSYLETASINAVCEALHYHNFTAIRPVKDCGEASLETSSEQRNRLLRCDLQKLREADALVAVINQNDAGTYSEIGVAYQLGKPVLIYDPKLKLDNLFTVGLATSKTDDIGDVINWVFDIAGGILREAIR